jgi:hypothetical protein
LDGQTEAGHIIVPNSRMPSKKPRYRLKTPCKKFDMRPLWGTISCPHLYVADALLVLNPEIDRHWVGV